ILRVSIGWISSQGTVAPDPPKRSRLLPWPGIAFSRDPILVLMPCCLLYCGCCQEPQATSSVRTWAAVKIVGCRIQEGVHHESALGCWFRAVKSHAPADPLGFGTLVLRQAVAGDRPVARQGHCRIQEGLEGSGRRDRGQLQSTDRCPGGPGTAASAA